MGMQGGLHAALPSISGHWSLIALTFFHHLPAGICSPVRREVTRPARGVELRQQNGFAGLNPSWSRKAFLASLQRCPSYCGKVLSTATGGVTRLTERGWGTESLWAEKQLFVATGEEGASWAENAGRAVP